MEFRKIEIREYALSWAMGLSETKASCPLPRFALSTFPDFVIFLVPWSGAEASHIPALNTFGIICSEVFGRFCMDSPTDKSRFYAHTFSRISSSAFLLLVWHLTTSALHRPASSTAHRTILWDTVFVKSTIRSGLPICLLRLADICVNTFALQLNLLHICLY